MIRVALLSKWHVHAEAYAKDISASKDMKITSVWDEDSARGKAWAKELNIPFEQDLQAVLMNPDIDAVVINTPTNMHKEVIIAAAKHKKHIFTEKVLAFTVQDCKEIYEEVGKAGVELMVSLPLLTENAFLNAEKAIAEGWLGNLTMIRCRVAHDGGVIQKGKTAPRLPARFFNKEQAGGGAMIDLGAHPIYLTNRLAGKAKGVYARLHQETQSSVDDNSAILVDYESGALGSIETSFLSKGSPFLLELYGTEGTFMIRDDEIRVHSIHLNEGKEKVLEEELPPLPMPMVQWVDAIKNGSTPTITKEDAIQLSLINEAAFTSHKKGRRVEVNEIIE